jgi:hypothetical protein
MEINFITHCHVVKNYTSSSSSSGLQLTHDAAHYIAAKKHDTKLSLPFFLPSLQIGIKLHIHGFENIHSQK